MAYPFPTHHSPSAQPMFLAVPQRARSNSRHSHHRAHSHSGHRDLPTTYTTTGYPYTATDYQYPLQRHPSHHSTHHYPASRSSHYLPQYTPSTHSHQTHSRSHSHSRNYAPTHYHYTRERTPSMGDRIRNFFGLNPSDQYSRHPSYSSHHHPHTDERRRRHNSFSSFRDDRPHRNNSVRDGPWFFGPVENKRYLDEHGREVDHRGRVIHRM